MLCGSPEWATGGSDENFDLGFRLLVLDELLQLRLALVLRQEVFDLWADLGEWDRSWRTPLVQLDDVIPEWRFDDVANSAGLEIEGRFFEGGRHQALLKEAQIAAVLRAAR